MSTIEQTFSVPSPATANAMDADNAQPVGSSTLQAIANWFVEAVPAPTEKNKAVQIGCHFEEAAEMLESIGETVASVNLSIVADCFKASAEVVTLVDRDALLDSLCDQIVTAIGVAHMFGLNIHGALAEVNRSNYSKFVDGKPVFDANGKIAKSASYSKPDLSPFVGSTA